jgi:hypothetical protein
MAVFSEFVDFGKYYFDAKALNLNYNIYTLDEKTRERLKNEFKTPLLSTGVPLHSPVFHFLITWVTVFGYRWACLLWFLFNHIVLGICVLLILRFILKKIVDTNKEFIFTTSLFLVLSYQPLIENVSLGQQNLIILLFFILCLYFLDMKRWLLSGVMLSLGIAIKPHFAILLPFFLWKKCYRVFFAALMSFLALEASSLLMYGKEIQYTYWNHVFGNFFRQFSVEISLFNLSSVALVNRLITGGPHIFHLNFATCLASIILLFLFLYTVYSTRDSFKGVDIKFILEFSLIITFLFIAFPLVHEHHYVLLYLPILFLWVILNNKGKLVPLFIFIISFLLIGLEYSLVRFTLFTKGFFSILSGLKLYGVVILFFLTASTIKEISEKEKKLAETKES